MGMKLRGKKAYESTAMDAERIGQPLWTRS